MREAYGSILLMPTRQECFQILAATNRRRERAVGAVALKRGLNWWLIPTYGWLGAAWSSLATDMALVVMNRGILKVLILRSQRRILYVHLNS